MSNRTMAGPAAAVVLGLLFALPAAAATDVRQHFPVLDGIPHSKAAGLVIEAALLFRDLGVLTRVAQRQRLRQMMTALGGRLWRTPPTDDVLAEFSRVLKLLAPTESVPAALVLGSAFSATVGDSDEQADQEGENQVDPVLQFVFKVEGDVLERALSAQRSETPPPWSASVTDGLLTIPIGGETLYGTVKDGWLRLAPEKRMLRGPSGPADDFLSAKLAAVSVAHDVVLAFSPLVGGFWTEQLRRGGRGETSSLLRDSRGAVLGYSPATDQRPVSAMRLWLDLPPTAALLPSLRRRTIEAADVWNYGPEMTSVASVQLPPMVLAASGPFLRRLADREGLPIPAPILDSLNHMAGRVDMVSFYSPGDWLVAVEFQQPAQVDGFLAALKPWIVTQADKLDVALEQWLTYTPGGELALRPHPKLEGLHFARVGRRLIVCTDAGRLEKLRRGPVAHKTDFLASLTPEVSRVVRTPAMLSAYTLLGDDGVLFEAAAWLAGAGQTALASAARRDPHLAAIEPLIRDLAAEMGLAWFTYMMTYDLAVSVDLDGTALSVELMTSEL